MPRCRLFLPLLLWLLSLCVSPVTWAQSADELCKESSWEEAAELKSWAEQLRQAIDQDGRRKVVRHMGEAAARMTTAQGRFVAALHVLAYLPADDKLVPGAAALVAAPSIAIARLPQPAPDDYATSCLAAYASFHRAMVNALAISGSEADKHEMIRAAVEYAARTAANATHENFIFEDIGIVIAARLTDRAVYLESMKTVAEHEWRCPKPATALCGLTQTADLAITVGAQQVGIAMLEDALELAEQPGVEPAILQRTRIALARAQWRYGRPSLAAEMMARLDPAAIERTGSLGDFAAFQQLRAEMADTMLDPEVALDAFRRIVARALKELRVDRGDKEDPDFDALTDAAARLTARHVRRRFCLDCGEPIAAPALEWLTDGAKERTLSAAAAAENYLLYRILPAEAANAAQLGALEGAFTDALGKGWTALSGRARRHLPARGGDAAILRAVALSVVLAGAPGDAGKSETHDKLFAFLVETDLEAKRKAWETLIYEAWPGMSESGVTERHFDMMDDYARHLSAAGYHLAARSILDFMSLELPGDDDKLVAHAQGRAPFWASVFVRLGALAVQMRDWDDANESLDLAARIVRTRLEAEWRAGPEQVGLLLRELKPVLRLLAQTRVLIATTPAATGAMDEARGKAFEELQLAMLGDTAIGLQAAQRRRIAADRRLAEAIAARDRGLSRLALLSAFDDTVGVLDRSARAAERRRIESEVEAATRGIEAILPLRGALGSPLPLSLEETRGLLAPAELLLVLHAGSDAIYGGLVAPSGEPVFWRVPIAARELDARVQALRKGLDLKEGYSEFPLRAAYELYKRLFGPVEAELERATSLLVVGDGPLVSFPLAVLPRSLPQVLPKDMRDYRRARVDFLGLSHAVAYLPTAGGLAVRGEQRLASKAALAFAGIGNPILADGGGKLRSVDYARLFKRGSLADVALLRQVVSLPETEGEVRTLGRLLAAGEDHLFLRNRASEPVVRRDGLNRYRIIMFATHGVVGGELSGASEPGLILTPPAVAAPEDDGLLTASEVLSLKLDADLVILSACNTAASDGRPRAEGFSGLTRAFLSAGARAVVATHWSIPSEPAVEVTTRMVEERRRAPGLAWSEALRRAFANVVQQSGPPEFAHPSAWAAFTVVGVEARLP